MDFPSKKKKRKKETAVSNDYKFGSFYVERCPVTVSKMKAYFDVT